MAETESRKQQINTDREIKTLSIIDKESYIDNLVSIITPAYNAAAYIAETIESVLAPNLPKLGNADSKRLQ